MSLETETLGRTPDTQRRMSRSIADLAAEARACRACPLWEHATQTVFGEGPSSADIMLIGEEPGDKEDLAGHPFVGPAGKLLDACLAEAGLDKGRLYVTNAVKHFKWEPKGARRIHKKPNHSEVLACRPWLLAEISAVQPKAILCLGSTAAQSLFEKPIKVTESRGTKMESPYAPIVMVTVHPSSLLRAPAEQRYAERELFLKDLRELLAAVRAS